MSEVARHSFVYERNRPGAKDKPDQLLNIQQVMKRLNLSRSMIYKLIHNGELKAVRFGKVALRVPLSELEDYIERRKEEFEWE